MQKFLVGLFAIGVMFLFSTPVAISGQLQHPCGRMMAGPEKTACNAAIWDISPFLSTTIEYRDISFYTFGYNFGYLSEQGANAYFSAGTVTDGKILVKNGLSMIGKLAPRTLGMLAIRFHFIKEALASLNLADDSVRLAHKGAVSSAAKQPTTGNPAASLATPGANDITTSQLLDPGGLVLAATDANGHITRNAYDSLARLTATATDPLTGNPADPAAPGFNPATFRSGTGILVTNLYDDLGNLIQVADGKNQLTSFTYDGLKRKTRTIWDPGTPVQRIELSEFNALLQTSRTDPKNQRTDYGHDSRHRNTTVSYLGHPFDDRLYQYDLTGKLLSVTYPNEPGSLREVFQTYDKLDRLTSETSAGVTHTYPLYDNAGNRLHTLYGSTGRALISSYDALNRLSSITEKDSLTAATGRLTTYGYDRRSKVTLKVLPNHNRSTTSYDFLARTTRIEERTATQFLLGASDYTTPVSPWPSSYDNQGNVLRIAETYSQPGMVNRVVTNTYDKVHRLSTETATPTTGPATLTSYQYDQANNRTHKTIAGITTVCTVSTFGDGSNGYNSNQLITYGTGVSYTYDLNGNRQTKTTAAGTENYAWDFENRLIKLTQPSGAKYHYTYDHRTRRLIRDESLAGGIKILLTYSGGTSVQESHTQEIHDYYADADSDGQNNFLEYALGSDPLSGSSFATFYAPGTYEQWAQAAILVRSTLSAILNYRAAHTNLTSELIRGSDWGGGIGGILYTIRNSTRSYNSYNSRGDVTSTTAGNGTATWQASYEAYGTRTQEQGSNAERQRANTKEEDPTGLLNEGHRYRDLERGTFITRDPLGFVDGPNVYTYVRQNPWTKFDPLGLEAAQNDFVGQVMDKINHLAESLFHASRDPSGAMASGVDKVINGAVGSPMTGPQEPLKSAGVYQEGGHADKGGDFMVAYAAAVGAAMEGPGIFKGRGPKTITEGLPTTKGTGSSQRLGAATAREIVEDAWTTIDSKGNVLKTDIQVRSIDDPSLLVTRGRGEGSHGALAESAGLTETPGLYGTTTTSVNGKVSEVMIGSDTFGKLPRKVLQEQRQIIAKQHEIPIEKVYMNKKSVAENE